MKSSPLAAVTAILAALLVVVTAGPALAHDALKSSNPAKDATVKSVDEVKLEFTGKIRMPFVSVRGPGDTQHQSGDPEVDGRVVTQRLKGELPDGDYTIAYRVVSSDGHPIEGEVPFTVKGASPSPSATPTQSASPAGSATAQPTDQPAAPEPAGSQPAQEVSAEDDAAAFPVWLLIVVGALVGIGIGFLLSARKKKP
ncbi:copper resistance protein CopC [Nonomuraea sp. MCN248]|uniref:Copper resistance protein CopC n=1 Tax=Nonomuraea corallina TaxID=2989783 RepID=A0ABT4SE94_9ACTN|nr:copper resistance protein CopC [Nonomuraea corallina]MDA0635511.1 copper resistance protein CopC [Nonomuraea corallina]